MDKDEFYIILIESLAHENKNAFFEAKRIEKSYTKKAYEEFLMKAISDLNNEVTYNNFEFYTLVKPGGISESGKLPSTLSQNYWEERWNIEKEGQVNFSTKRVIEIRRKRNDRPFFYLTNDIVSKIWEGLYSYLFPDKDHLTSKSLLPVLNGDEIFDFIEIIRLPEHVVSKYISSKTPDIYGIPFLPDFDLDSAGIPLPNNSPLQPVIENNLKTIMSGSIPKRNVKRKITYPFIDHLECKESSKEELASICNEIFNSNSSEQEFAVMIHSLLGEGLIKRISNFDGFCRSWYDYINKPYPGSENFTGISRYLSHSKSLINDSPLNDSPLINKFKNKLKLLNLMKDIEK